VGRQETQVRPSMTRMTAEVSKVEALQGETLNRMRDVLAASLSLAAISLALVGSAERTVRTNPCSRYICRGAPQVLPASTDLALEARRVEL
jgi:hypothetical protein